MNESPPFSFVTVSGPISISTDLDEMLPWAIRIAARYMGDTHAEQFGRRNAVEGELLLRLRAARVLAVCYLVD